MTEPDPMTLPWSDPRADVIGQFRAFIAEHMSGYPLAPWQVEMAEAYLSGKSMVVAPRRAGRSQVERAVESFTKYRPEPKPVRGCHTVIYDEIADWDQTERDRRWSREFLGTWDETYEPHIDLVPGPLSGVPEPRPELSLLDLCVQVATRR